MSILSISRDWGVNPCIVRITTTDNLATITATDYLTTQEDVINEINNGDFQWELGDTVLIYYSDGQGFFTRDIVNNTFDAFPSSPGSLPSTLQDGDIFVGNASNVATGVTPSGDITLTNAGVFGIASGVIVNADISPSAAIALSKIANVTASAILHGDGSGNITGTVVSGDIILNSLAQATIVPSAVTATKLASDAVTTVKILDANVTLSKLAPGIKPSHVVRFGGQSVFGGGSSSVAIPISGVTATDLPFASIQASTNAVTIQKVTSATNQITITMSGDPGAGTTINYQVLVVAS